MAAIARNGWLLTPAEVAELLGVARSWVYKKARAGELPVVRLGEGPKAPVRVDSNDLRAWLAASESGQRETR